MLLTRFPLTSCRRRDWALTPTRKRTAVLPWQTRLYLWLGLGAFALVGLYGGDYFFPETDEEKAARGEAVSPVPTETGAAGSGAPRERGGKGAAAGKQV